ncbi:queuosine 5'-phosphate N-glycosylase/hydrolase [Cylas formicarius]|uniref:queuosine 5'-phosphate N-glycosylase/hydrolase n=1 Tax=Cylas formicarius TaxID=197179 RepID=UPI0029585454|nr:queuosine 5'-phosphate N-glycosylase/hydrolase [Cylas formicarius]
MLGPRESGELIAGLAENVTINNAAIEKLGDVLVDQISAGRLIPDNFSQVEVHPKAEDNHALAWIFIVDTLNFCFWHHEHEEGWKVDGYTGYFALCAAINRALKEKVDILNPMFFSVITDQQLRKVLRGDTEVETPLLFERVKCLREVGSVLLEKFEGSFQNVVKQANNDAKQLLKLIVENFKCFRDEAEYRGRKVAFYKRAQILVADIWACFRNLKNINQITMFADYRVPQTLLWFGVFTYSERLHKKLSENVVLNCGESDEVEIRGCSIHAVELLKKYAVAKLGAEGKINSVLIDHFLWDFRRKHAGDILNKGLPFHKTFGIYY